MIPETSDTGVRPIESLVPLLRLDRDHICEPTVFLSYMASVLTGIESASGENYWTQLTADEHVTVTFGVSNTM